MHRVYISAPGDLEAEREACRAVIGETNERLAMPSKVLLVSVGLPQEGALDQYRAAVADNIRQCRYYIQIFQDDWGPRNLSRKMFYLAYDGRSDGALPMQEVIVLLKAAPRETDPEILGFRKELAELSGVQVISFESIASMQEQLRPALAGWASNIIAAQEPATTA